MICLQSSRSGMLRVEGPDTLRPKRFDYEFALQADPADIWICQSLPGIRFVNGARELIMEDDI